MPYFDIVGKLHAVTFKRKHKGLSVVRVAQLLEDGQGFPCVSPCIFGHRAVVSARGRVRGRREGFKAKSSDSGESGAAGSGQGSSDSS